MRTNNLLLSHLNNRLVDAIRKDNVEAVSAWLVNPMIDPRELTCEGRPLLHFAIEEGCINSFFCLLSDTRIDPDGVDEQGNSPLHIAIIAREIDMVDYLLTCSHVNTNKLSADGMTPLMLACLSGYYDCLPLLGGCSTGVAGLEFPPYDPKNDEFTSRLLSDDQFLTYFLTQLVKFPSMMNSMLQGNFFLLNAARSFRQQLVDKLLNPTPDLIEPGNYIALLKTIVGTRSHPLHKILSNPPILNAFWATFFPNEDPYIDAIKNKLVELEQPSSRIVKPVAIVYAASDARIPSIFGGDSML